jgi:hypothetical protein
MAMAAAVDGHGQCGSPVNDAPVANPGRPAPDQHPLASIAVLANDTDVDGNPWRDGERSSHIAQGTVSQPDGT